MLRTESKHFVLIMRTRSFLKNNFININVHHKHKTKSSHFNYVTPKLKASYQQHFTRVVAVGIKIMCFPTDSCFIERTLWRIN